MGEWTQFFILRHGAAEGNVEDPVTGRKQFLMGQFDSPLVEQGIREAHELAEAPKDVPFDVVFTSPLVRTRETANILASHRGLPVYLHNALIERYWGALQELSWEQIARRTARIKKEAFHKNHEELMRYKVPFPDAKGRFPESTQEVVTRLTEFLLTTSLVYPGKTLAAVTHTGIISSFLVSRGLAKHDGFWPPNIVKNTGYVKVVCDGTNVEIAEMSGVEI